MRDPERIARIVEKLRLLWLENPDQRLGQLVVNLLRQQQGTTYSGVMFNVEDCDWERMIDDTIENGW